MSSLSRSLFFGAVDGTDLDLSVIPLVTLRLFWSSLPYLALTVLLAILSRSPLFAASGTIMYGSVFELLAPGLSSKFPWLLRYLPVSLAQVLQSANAAIDRSVPPAASLLQLQASLLIAAIFLILSLTSLLLFSRQDLGG